MNYTRETWIAHTFNLLSWPCDALSLKIVKLLRDLFVLILFSCLIATGNFGNENTFSRKKFVFAKYQLVFVKSHQRILIIFIRAKNKPELEFQHVGMSSSILCVYSVYGFRSVKIVHKFLLRHSYFYIDDVEPIHI